MKFVKSDLAKKLIIILIVLLLFNALYPSMTYAVDLGGILLQPLYWLLLGIYIPTDLLIGATIQLKDFSWGDLNNNTNKILDGNNGGLSSWFVGPDTIFKRTNQVF